MAFSDQRVAQIEAVYVQSVFIREVCVAPRANADGSLHAIVVPDLDALRAKRIVNIGDWIRFEMEGRSIFLPPEARVSSHEIWFAPLPRDASGAVDRVAVDAMIQSHRQRREATQPRPWPTDDSATEVLDMVAKCASAKRSFRPEDNLEIDLGIDSMARVELLLTLSQRTGVTIASDAAHHLLTVSDLVDAFRTARPRVSTGEEVDPWRTVLSDLSAVPAEIQAMFTPRPAATFGMGLLFRALCSAMAWITVSGLEHVPARGPFLLCPNHQSYLDPVFVCRVLPHRVLEQVFVVGAAEYFETPITRRIARFLNLVPVDPDGNLVSAMQAAASGLTRGRVLLLFPEGERSIDGNVKRFKKGAAILSRRLDVPVVPVAIKGVFDIWPRNRPFNTTTLVPWRRTPVQIAFGPPMSLRESSSDAAAAAELQQTVDRMWYAL